MINNNFGSQELYTKVLALRKSGYSIFHISKNLGINKTKVVKIIEFLAKNNLTDALPLLTREATI